MKFIRSTINMSN